MLRNTLLIALILGTASSARASNWAEGMFEEFSFDFGAVPRGQVVRHPFRIVNNTRETVHIASLGVSCGCTTAWPLQSTLAPGQETAIIAQMNSGAPNFYGVRSIQIYVRFDAPRIQEVTLSVQANSRSELAFFPDSLDFRKIKRGTTPTAQMIVTFQGNTQFLVTDAKCDSNFIQPKLQELRREGNEVIYQVSATARPDIPEGKWYTDVWLTTNNAIAPRLRVPLTIEVEPAPVQAPAPTPAPPPTPTPPPVPPAPGKPPAKSVILQPIKAGQQSERTVTLRGTQPFRITGIQGADQELIVRPVSTESRTTHDLILTFRPSQAGQVNRTIRVHTDMSNNPDIEFNAQAQVEK